MIIGNSEGLEISVPFLYDVFMEVITSLQNNRIKKWASMHQKKERDKTGLFLVEGEHLIEEALKADVVETLITDRENIFSFEPCVQVNEPIMNRLSENVSGAHWIAVCHKQTGSIEHGRRYALLDAIQDPGNLGTIVRTAVSFGFDAVYCSKDTCDIYNEKAVRSSQGALFHIPVIYEDLTDTVNRLQKEGTTIIATTLERSLTMSEVEPCESMAFIFGNEGAGVSHVLQDMADKRLRIEMHRFDSLNVAVASGIVMYNYR